MSAKLLMDVEQQLDDIQTVLSESERFPCTRMKNGRACTLQHMNLLDKEDRPIFFFGIDCQIVKTFCPSCLAYWLVAVARNCLIEIERSR